ncbi:hypothetical protein CGLO_01914 [Colletotrichum gloeosporioides Cg-14]|uniref:DUF676 domain-containing protein n=1 Tax=Colletotrichum gloeosporioides (strain Cg-14) TaxID=1237896 RepID=T0L071_COLGC|nr:hypothetical protein CGLO_01914 [Colletotrichum gloeosporioides Cg-14]
MANQSSSNTFTAISNPLEPSLDVIALHGMNLKGNSGHAENTWTHENGVNWLRSLLPRRLPFARILAFQYNAKVSSGSSIAGVKAQSINLLNCLKNARKMNETRPMIFIAHSLGGVIVKEALSMAYEEHKTYPMIWIFTYGIFFLAVPHKGSPFAAWGQILRNILYMNEPSNSFLESVTEQSNYNKELSARFEHLIESYKVYSWIEGLSVGYFGIIVPEDSAKLGLSPAQEFCRVADRDHRSICKFSGDDDREWIVLSGCLGDAARAAVEFRGYSPIMAVRKAMLASSELENIAQSQVLLSEAIEDGQNVIDRVDYFLSGDEYRKRAEVAASARNDNITLATWFLALMSPLFASEFLAGIVIAAIVALLPSKENALEKGSQGQENEQRIIEVESWAIERLGGHLQNVLRSSSAVRHAIRYQELEEQNERLALELNHAQYLQNRLQQQISLITDDLYERHGSRNMAEYVCVGIEKVRTEAAGKTKQHFYFDAIETIKEEKEKAEGKGWYDWCWNGFPWNQ